MTVNVQHLTRRTRLFHRILMAIVGIQMFIWAATGTYMVWINIHTIHGDHLLNNRPILAQIESSDYSIKSLLRDFPKAQYIRLQMHDATPVYLFKQFRQNKIVHAKTGEVLSFDQAPNLFLANIDEIFAPDTFIPEEMIISVNLLTESTPDEVGTRGMPLWQVQLNDWENTTFYISQNTSEIAYVRHDRWRIFDLFWRLHIMDYTEGEDTGNYLLSLSSVVALAAVLTGCMLLYLRLRLNASPALNLSNSNKRTNKRQNKLAGHLSFFVKRTHKWFACIVFVQLLIWIVTGFLLGQVDYDVASGQLSLSQNSSSISLSPRQFPNSKDVNHETLQALLRQFPNTQMISLVRLERKWLYQLQQQKGRHDYWPSQYRLFNAKTGEKVDIDGDMAERLALTSVNKQYAAALQKVPSQNIMATLLSPPIKDLPNEYNNRWQIFLGDDINTAVYVDADNGNIIRHVNDTTRWRNLLLQLHFMDYLPRIDTSDGQAHLNDIGAFNNVLIKVFSVFTLALSLTGLTWLVSVLKSPKRTLLDDLIANNQMKTANCGGGGTCGLCAITCKTPPPANNIEKSILSAPELKRGIRLACQHKAKTLQNVSLASKSK